MELIDGYKQTEVGVIPDDWDVCELQDAVEFLDSQRRPIKSSERAKMKGEYPYYGASGIVDFVNSYIFDEELILLGEDGENILSRTLPLAFKVSGKIWVNNHAHVLRPNTNFDIKYLTEFLESRDYTLLNSGTAQPKLNKQACSGLKIARPSKKEQSTIAKALSDADALISQLEKLIIKKRLIKQGAMQKLLDPFDENEKLKNGWVEKRLGDTAVLKARIGWQGLTTAEYKTSGDYCLITGTEFKDGFIDWDKCFFVEYERYKQDRNIQVKQFDVLVTKDGTIGKVAFIRDVPKLATLNSGVFVIRPIDDAFDPEFFFYVLKSNIFSEFLAQLSAGSTINHLYQKDFVHFKYYVPSDNQVQKELAKIFSDMDKDIDHLTIKLSKIKQLKQGMMQSLLTGKIRLVEKQRSKP
ncbi:restriction endonuclease subunit S [Desulfobacter curvatus]|uniref:restriction endonuclease subunit S n=1 Tax=Desulfobacter curvatus TaxID=2290 RepID=UPI00036C1F42|nr:restriction endonuclease subunit S [Desulfobacter curvatus]